MATPAPRGGVMATTCNCQEIIAMKEVPALASERVRSVPPRMGATRDPKCTHREEVSRAHGAHLYERLEGEDGSEEVVARSQHGGEELRPAKERIGFGHGRPCFFFQSE